MYMCMHVCVLYLSVVCKEGPLFLSPRPTDHTVMMVTGGDFVFSLLICSAQRAVSYFQSTYALSCPIVAGPAHYWRSRARVAVRRVPSQSDEVWSDPTSNAHPDRQTTTDDPSPRPHPTKHPSKNHRNHRNHHNNHNKTRISKMKMKNVVGLFRRNSHEVSE